MVPIGQTQTISAPGDFGNAIALALQRRCAEKGDLSIAQLNRALDQLNIATERYLMRFYFLAFLEKNELLFSSIFLDMLQQLNTSGLYVLF